LAVFVIGLLAAVLFSLSCYWLDWSEKTLHTGGYILFILCAFGAGFSGARKCETKGWLWGMIAALLCMLLMFASAILLTATSCSLWSLITRLPIGLGAGAVGGIFGINLKH